MYEVWVKKRSRYMVEVSKEKHKHDNVSVGYIFGMYEFIFRWRLIGPEGVKINQAAGRELGGFLKNRELATRFLQCCSNFQKSKNSEEIFRLENNSRKILGLKQN